MVAPYLRQPNYMQAMNVGLRNRLAYMNSRGRGSGSGVRMGRSPSSTITRAPGAPFSPERRSYERAQADAETMRVETVEGAEISNEMAKAQVKKAKLNNVAKVVSGIARYAPVVKTKEQYRDFRDYYGKEAGVLSGSLFLTDEQLENKSDIERKVHLSELAGLGDGDPKKLDYLYRKKLISDKLEADVKRDKLKKGAPSGLSTRGKWGVERQTLLDSGYREDSPEVVSYDKLISGDDSGADMSDEEVGVHAARFNLTGKLIPLGRGKASAKIRKRIAKAAATLALKGTGIDPGEKTPMEAALSIVGSAADTKSIGQSQNFLEKQLGSMGSFVGNMGAQVTRIKELSEGLMTSDINILNMPLRFVRGHIVGSELQAKYDLLLTEIEQEAGKLSTGSTASIAELSASAQDRWDKIHNKNLSVEKMMGLLEETQNAASMRYQSVSDQLSTVRKKMKTRDYGDTPEIEPDLMGALRAKYPGRTDDELTAAYAKFKGAK